jgi:hypothetical protein
VGGVGRGGLMSRCEVAIDRRPCWLYYALMKPLLKIIAISLLLAAIILGGCNGSPASQVEPTVKPTPEPTPEPAPEPPVFEIVNLAVEPEAVIAGSNCTVAVDVRNDGGMAGDYEVVLKVDGQRVDATQIQREPGLTEAAQFTLMIEKPGSAEIAVGELTKTINVLKPAELEAISIETSRSTLFTGQAAEIKASVRNAGEVTGNFTIPLVVNGSEADSQTVSLAPDATDEIRFLFTRDAAGSYQIGIGGLDSAVEVVRGSTYTNEMYWYSISYPQDFRLNEIEPVTVQMEKPGVGGVTVLVDKVPVSETPGWYFDATAQGKKQQLPDWTVTSQTEITEDGAIIGYAYEYSNTVDGKMWIGKGMVFKKGGYGFYVIFTTLETVWGDYESVADACLDSFVLPNIVTGSYTDDTYRFSLALPDGWSGIVTTNPTVPMDIYCPYDQAVVVGSVSVKTVADGSLAKDHLSALIAPLLEDEYTNLVSEGDFIFTDGSVGYEVVTLTDFLGLLKMKVKLVCSVRGDQAFVIMFTGKSANQAEQEGATTALSKSFSLLQ